VILLRTRGLQVRLAARSSGDSPNRLVLDGIDLDLAAGTLRGVVGPSGCGKSTLLRALAGLVPRAGGTLTFEGHSIDELAPASWRRRIGLLPQRPALLPYSVADNLGLPATFRSAREVRPVDRDPAAMLDALGLPDDALGRPVTELSEGQAARVGLARAVMAGPSVLLLDEPTAALDRESASQVEVFLRELAAEGLALLWVLHDPDVAARLPMPPLELGPAGGSAR